MAEGRAGLARRAASKGAGLAARRLVVRVVPRVPRETGRKAIAGLATALKARRERKR